MGKNVGLRIHLAQCFDDLLAATHANEPVVDNCDLHRGAFDYCLDLIPPASGASDPGADRCAGFTNL